MVSHHNLEKDDFNTLFYTPRTLTTLFAILIIFNLGAYFGVEELRERTKAYYYDPANPDIFENYRWPIFFAFLLLLSYAWT